MKKCNEKEYKDLYDKIMGLIVIDVVEGTGCFTFYGINCK